MLGVLVDSTASCFGLIIEYYYDINVIEVIMHDNYLPLTSLQLSSFMSWSPCSWYELSLALSLRSESV